MAPPPDRCVAGIDVGSTLTKVVVANGRVLASATGRTEVDYVGAAARLLADALERAGEAPARLGYVVATGYGRRRLPFADREITEITCHARGVREVLPGARTIIDIGGQDAKGIKLGPSGKVVNFAMNDKCAAGTGRFLEVIAASLGLTIDELGRRGLGGASPASISSVCTVFAEQEVSQRLAEGATVEDVLAGLHVALASRVHRMVKSLGVEPPVVLTGGCARNAALLEALQERLGIPLTTPPEPLLTGALGAAALAADAVARGEARTNGDHLEALARDAEQAGRGVVEDRARRRIFSAHARAAPYALDGQFALPPGGPAPSGPAGGIDAGALFTKAVVVHGDRVSFAVLRTEGNHAEVAARALERAAGVAGIPTSALAGITATGLGAGKLSGARESSDVTCLAAGVARLVPDASQAIDIGGHGTRVIRIGPGGTVKGFVVSGQCAAGSARILEVMAHLLGLELDRLGEVSLSSREPAPFSAGCAVFAETEAITLLTRGTASRDLLAGLHRSMAAKILAMARAGGTPRVVAVAGGGARDTGLVAQLRGGVERLAVPPEPLVVAALGAALLGAVSAAPAAGGAG